MEEPEELSFQFLREITDDFSEKRKLGEDAFGTVYKGVTPHGEDVVVKKLKLYGDYDYRQFRNEFYNLTKLKHQNIVQFLGYCYEIEKKPFIMPDGIRVLVEETYGALCFEYLHNGSLKNHLSDEFCGLDWHTRFKIIKGICDGLKYIHKLESLLHLDLNPDNILLDNNMVPKIAEFGLSMMVFADNVTRTTQSPIGTWGYRPPEYINKGEISEKFDIFSLGVIMIRIVSGHEGYYKWLAIPSAEFIDQVGKNWGNRLQATCSSDSLLEAYCNQVETCTKLALRCVEQDSQKRPDILNIIDKLNETETAIGEKQGRKTASEVILPKKWKKKKSMDITGQNQDIDLMTVPHCNELEIDDAQETQSDIVQELVVGRTKEKQKIMASLLNVMSINLAILPIYGMGGIGKTTFARLIYNDPKFENYSHVWVDVSRVFSLNKILHSIISQLSAKENQAKERRHEIHKPLTELLSGKKILIVLDDLWDEDPFKLQELKHMLYHNESNIIILVTTRSEHVAEIICTNLEPYKILPLTNEMCWDIVKQRSCFESRHDKEHLEDIGKKIAQKCGGVALAAKSLGYTLLSMNFDQWIQVENSNIWNEPVSKDVNDVLASLKLSYSCMDSCLQKCFTYCAVFPKGHKIVKDDLIYQWISLGFIKPSKLFSIMQLCEKYITHLLRLSFFQHAVTTPERSGVDHYHVLPCFTMPHLVHDMACSVIRDAIPRYALLSDCSKPLEWSCTSAATLRALRFWHCWRTELHGCAFTSAESLQVLDLSECFIQKLPDSIGNLKELRYLNAPGIQDRMIPTSLTKLQNLIYLNLHGSSLLSAIPESIGEMDSLMHLNLSDCSGIETLPESLGKLKRLVHLNLANCGGISALPESIGEMDHLVDLNLSDCSGIERLPKSIGKLERLVNLNLANCSSVKGVSESLGILTELQYLNLSQCKNIHLSDGVQLHQRGLHEIMRFLTNLRYLNLSGCVTGLNETSSSINFIGTLSKLEHLDLSDNTRLTTLPLSIANLKKMHTLDLSGCINLLELPTALGETYNLKLLILDNCISLRFSGLHQLSNSKVVPPKFVVKAHDGLSNLALLLDAKNTDVLNISGLENVKSTEEAIQVKLMGKTRITELMFDWTRDAERYVKDRKVLEYLVPPKTLNKFKLRGYCSEIFPYWLMGIAHYLPYVTTIIMEDLANCDSLPPLGQLRHLAELVVRGMDSITVIDESFYGGPTAFRKLKKLELSRMGGLQVWKTMYSFEDGVEESMSKLEELTINDCAMLRLVPCPPSVVNWKIDRSDNVLLSWGEGAQNCTSSTTVREVSVKSCKVPLHQWRFLHHTPALTRLSMERCIALRSISQEVIKCLSGLQSLSLEDNNDQPQLPEWLGELTSLRDLVICGHPDMKAPLGVMKKMTSLKKLQLSGCERMTVLPHWLVELTSLQSLEISDCPKLNNLDESVQHLTSIKTLALRNCRSISVLPDCLGDLGTLKKLVIQNCMGIKNFPNSLTLTELEELKIIDCPDLDQWCQSDEKMIKLINRIESMKEKDYHTISRNQRMDCKIQNTALEPIIDLMTHAQLEEITNGFSEDQIIGQGAHGKVYWGLHKNGKKIAVKEIRVNIEELDDQQFLNELKTLIMLNHRNIVQLVAYCSETQDKYVQYNGKLVSAETRYRALCLEHLHNGSLRQHLHDESGGPNWHTRYNIIKGTCEGLKYLHKKSVYHLDLKPDNILLAEDMVPKLADFGLSKVLCGDHTWTTQNFAGTRGYMAPEYINGHKVSDKVDIFSLGVVMMQIIAGPEGRTRYFESPGKFIDDVTLNWRNRLQATCHGSLVVEAYCKQVRRCTQLSLNCAEDDRDKRPSIVDIISELDSLERLI